MPPKPTRSRRTRLSKDEAAKLEKSARSFGTLLILSALITLLFGLVMIWYMAVYGFSTFWLAGAIDSFLAAAALFWCVRLLDQRKKLARNVFVVIIISGWIAAFLARLVANQPLFRWLDLVALILPVIVLTSMNHLISKRILT